MDSSAMSSPANQRRIRLMRLVWDTLSMADGGARANGRAALRLQPTEIRHIIECPRILRRDGARGEEKVEHGIRDVLVEIRVGLRTKERDVHQFQPHLLANLTAQGVLGRLARVNEPAG